MIWEFVPDVLVLLGFGGVLFILIRKSHSLSDQDVHRALEETVFVRRVRAWYQEAVGPHVNAQNLERAFWTALEKFFRSMRIVNFKVENWATTKLEWVKSARKRERFDDTQYWFSVHKLLVEKKIDELFGNVPVTDLTDPVKEELSLKRRRKEPVEQWLNLVRWYLERNHVSEARRVLISCWQKNPSDERVLALLEMLIVKTEEGGDMPMPKVASIAEKEQEVSQEITSNRDNETEQPSGEVRDTDQNPQDQNLV